MALWSTECRVGDCILAGRFKRVTWGFVRCRVCGLRYPPILVVCKVPGHGLAFREVCRRASKLQAMVLAGGLAEVTERSLASCR